MQGRNYSSIRRVLLKNIRKIRRMRKQSISGLPSFRGWPGVEATISHKDLNDSILENNRIMLKAINKRQTSRAEGQPQPRLAS